MPAPLLVEAVAGAGVCGVGVGVGVGVVGRWRGVGVRAEVDDLKTGRSGAARTPLIPAVASRKSTKIVFARPGCLVSLGKSFRLARKAIKAALLR